LDLSGLINYFNGCHDPNKDDVNEKVTSKVELSQAPLVGRILAVLKF
jgi:hypothetical protein